MEPKYSPWGTPSENLKHPLVPAPPWSVLLECPMIPAFIYLVSKKECGCIQMTASFLSQGNDHHHVT